MDLELQFKEVSFKQQIDFKDNQILAAAFNYNSTLLAVGISTGMFILKPQNGDVGSNYQLIERQNCLTSQIIFSHKENWFITNAYDGVLVLWKENKSSWSSKQLFEENTEAIFYIQLTKNDQELITSDIDFNIKVWSFNSEEGTLQLSYVFEKAHDVNICSFTLNHNEDTLLSLDFDRKLVLWKKNQNGQFRKVYDQTFENLLGQKICFTYSDEFAWLQQNANKALIFQVNENNFTEKKEFDIELKDGSYGEKNFEMIFSPSYNLLFTKHDKYYYIIERLQNGKYEIKYAIEAEKYYNSGAISRDFRSVVIYRNESKQVHFYHIGYQSR